MYILCEETVIIEGKSYLTYGIAKREDKTTLFADVSTDKKRMMGFIKRLNDAKIEPDHLMFYIDDFLCE